MNNCPECNTELIQVSEVHNLILLSCINEKCINHAELIINIGENDQPSFIRFDEMLKAMNTIDITKNDEPLLLDNDLKHQENEYKG